MTRWLLSWVALASFLAAGVMQADGPAPENYFDSRWAEVEKAFQASKESREFSRAKEELRKFFSSEGQDLKDLGLRWVYFHKADLNDRELEGLEDLFIELNPANSLSYGVRSTRAWRHFDNAPMEQKAVLYRRAVSNEKAVIEGVVEMPRQAALGLAALDGLEEFRPFIEQYREEIDRAYPADPYRRSEKLLWILKLRAGARDRADAVRLHAARLVEMEDERLARLMDGDPAFREATMNVLQSACEKRLAEPCLDMGRVALRQSKLREQQVKAGPRKQVAIPENGSDWLEGLRGLTGAARVKVERERMEASTKQPQ